MYTTSFSWSTFQDSFEDVYGEEENFEEVSGPFGFGVGTGLRSIKDQCLKKEYFVPNSESCVRNPKHCKDGLSFSIWEKPFMDPDILQSINLVDNAEEYIYIMSTGGDTKGHPGFALAHQEHWLIAIVSTGEQFWKVRALGVLMVNSWNNIGVVWNNTEDGLSVYVNVTKVGQKRVAQQSTDLLPLDPPSLMIGCHKDSSNEEYRGFNDADFDEFAIWSRELNGSEIEWMAGGYQENHSSISPEQLASFIDRVNMKDPAQQGAAVAILEKLTAPGPTSTEASPTSPSTVGTSSTATSPIFASQATTPKSDPESVQEMENLFKIFESILDTNKLPDTLNEAQMKSYLKVLNALNNIFDEGKTLKWLGLQEDTDEAGAIQLLELYRVYQKELLKRTRFTNESEPFCFSNAYSNLIAENCKMTVADMKEKGRMFLKLNYKDQNLKKYKKMWDMPYDRIAFPTDIIGDERCDQRGISINFVLYNTVPNFAHTGVNPANINPNSVYAIDSRIITYEVGVDHSYHLDDEIDTSQPICTPDLEHLKKNPIRIKLQHRTKRIALRKLQFHENEVVTDIAVRRCVWWNPNISDFGAWDSYGCNVLETTDEYTKCTCNNFGTFAILAEKTEPIPIPEEPYWLTILKYVLYGISAVAVILYIIVVTISGDLKDQFHLMGLNLAVSILAGSIVMVLTDLNGIRSDRHTCVAFGTMIHFFYGAVGVWMFALGHASFKAITAGVIGGRLQSYMFMCWGAALALIGIPYVCYLHDLGTDPRCFIGWINGVKLIFFVPQVICAGAAMFYAIVILCNLSTPALRKENLIEDYGSFCRGAALLLILLSLTWTFGLLAYVRFDFTEPDFYPIFQVLNSLAGVALFIFIGVGSNRFRMFVKGQAKNRRKMLKAHAFGLPDTADEDTATLGSPADQNADDDPPAKPKEK